MLANSCWKLKLACVKDTTTVGKTCWQAVGDSLPILVCRVKAAVGGPQS